MEKKFSDVLAFIDIETTGHIPIQRVQIKDRILFQLWHEIVDIGVVFVDVASLEPVGEDFSILVRPEYPDRCMQNPINNYPVRAAVGEWDTAVSLEDGIRKFLAACQQFGKKVIPVPAGQNFTFDWLFLNTAFAFCGIGEEEINRHLSYHRLDTFSMALQGLWDANSFLCVSDYSLRSERLQAKLGLQPENLPHRGINGAYQSYRVFKALAERKVIRL